MCICNEDGTCPFALGVKRSTEQGPVHAEHANIEIKVFRSIAEQSTLNLVG